MLEDLIMCLKWSLDQLDPKDEGEAKDEIATCPYDYNHHIHKSLLANHIESCRLRKLEYIKEEDECVILFHFPFSMRRIKLLWIKIQFKTIKKSELKLEKSVIVIVK